MAMTSVNLRMHSINTDQHIQKIQFGDYLDFWTISNAKKQAFGIFYFTLKCNLFLKIRDLVQGLPSVNKIFVE